MRLSAASAAALFLACLLCLAFPAPADEMVVPTDSMPAEEPAQEQDSAVREALDSLLDAQRAQLTEIFALSQKMGREINARTGAFRRNISLLQQEFQKVSALSQSAAGIPAELSFLTEQLQRILERINAELSPILSDMDILRQKKLSLDILEKSLTSFADPEEQKKTESLLRNASRNISILLERLENAAAPARDIAEKAEQSTNAIMLAMPSMWKDYYLESSGHFYDLAEWGRDIRAVSSFRETFSLRLGTELPASLRDWLTTLARMASAFVVLLLAAWTLRGAAGKSLPPGARPGVERVLRNSFLWIATGISLHFAAWADGRMYQLLASAGTMFLCWGELALAWDLFDIDKPERRLLTPLWPMFPPLIAGMLLLNFDPFPHFICVAWLAVQIIDLWLAHRRPEPLEKPQRAAMRLHHWQRWITLIISLAGYARLSILINMFLTACLSTAMLCMAIIRTYRLIEKRMPQNGMPAVLASLAAALVLPLVFLAVVSATLLWLLAYPGGGYVLQHVASLGFSVGGFSINAMQVLSILIAFYLAKTLIAVGNTFMAGMSSQLASLPSTLLLPFQTIYRYLLWAVFGLYALKALGFNLSSLSLIAGGLSVGIGIGLQNVVQNFASGLLVIFSRAIREGDVVETGGVLGVVKKINIRSTVLQTYDNATIFVPNSSFLGGTFTNWTHNNRRVRRDITVGVAYGSDVRECMETMLGIAREHPKVLLRPEPSVLFTDFGASSLDLRLLFWVRDYDDALSASSDIRLKINDAFAEKGIEISFPQVDVHMREDSRLLLEKAAEDGGRLPPDENHA
ncbi:MAG: mechanosensitive ion channel [Mailhella sp.]|nr:mechanosensitive ion channel [Mailhella sp.]